MGHSYGTLLWDTQRAFRTRLPPKVTRQASKTSVSYETSSKSHTSSLQNESFVRDILKTSHVKVCQTSVSYETSSKSQAETPIGAHTSSSLAKQFRDSSPSKQHPLTRQSQWDSDIHLYKGTLRGCKTSVLYETSFKSHASSLQNERFVRDFLQKSHVKSPKRAFRTRHPQKVTRQVSKTSVSHETSSKTHSSKSAKRAFRTRLPPKVKRKHPSEHTRHAALPSSFAIPAPPNNIRSHANPNVTATFTIHLYHNSQPHASLRLPRIFPHPHV